MQKPQSRVLRIQHFLNSPLERILRNDLFLEKLKKKTFTHTAKFLGDKKGPMKDLKFGKLTQYFCIKSIF